VLDRIPAGATESFAGVGYFFDLADISRGETVVELGSGSGMDAFYAAQLTGASGRVVGVDFTVEQLTKARQLAAGIGLTRVEFREGHIEHLPATDASVDCVISNGVINLSPDKERVFAEAARVLRPGGRPAAWRTDRSAALIDPSVGATTPRPVTTTRLIAAPPPRRPVPAAAPRSGSRRSHCRR